MAYIGSCPDMCPETERQTRFGLYMSIFERDQQNQPDEYAMVKEYRRSGADQEEPLPKDLRTPQALQMTMDYLVCNIMDDSRSTSLELALEWYDFLWDRLRAIRKDLTQQNICDEDSTILVERCARFHVYSCYVMNRVKDFDVDMNKRNLNDCLQMLRQMYTDLKISSDYSCPGELEFQKYDILLHLTEDHLSSNVLMKTSIHRSTNEMKFLTKIFNAYTNNDYYKYFQAMEQADYMMSCLLSLYANQMRLIAMKTIASSCPPRQITLYPFDLIKITLGFDDNDDISNFATMLEIPVQEKDSKNYLAISKELVSQLRRLGSSLPAFKSKRLVESKMNGRSVGRIVYGGELPENPYRRFPQRKVVDMEFEEDDIGVEENVCGEEEAGSLIEEEEENYQEEDNYVEEEEGTDEEDYIGEDELMAEQHRRDDDESNDEEDFEDDEKEKGNETAIENKAVSQICHTRENQESFANDEVVFEPIGSNQIENVQLKGDNEKLSFEEVVNIDKAYHEINKIETHDGRDSKLPAETQASQPNQAITKLNPFVSNITTPAFSWLKNVETDVDVPSSDEEEEEEDSFGARMIMAARLKRIAKNRDDIAKIMPAGRFKQCSLALKRPTLKMSPATPKKSTNSLKRHKSNGERESINSISLRIDDEEKVNQIFSQLANLITN